MVIALLEAVRVSNTIVVQNPYYKQVNLLGVYRCRILQPIHLLQVFLEIV
ncbi:hypothetical protein NSTC731_03132 [Nostoc sp. DSM 114167]|jgi:hypothetical protein